MRIADERLVAALSLGSFAFPPGASSTTPPRDDRLLRQAGLPLDRVISSCADYLDLVRETVLDSLPSITAASVEPLFRSHWRTPTSAYATSPFSAAQCCLDDRASLDGLFEKCTWFEVDRKLSHRGFSVASTPSPGHVYTRCRHGGLSEADTRRRKAAWAGARGQPAPDGRSRLSEAGGDHVRLCGNSAFWLLGTAARVPIDEAPLRQLRSPFYVPGTDGTRSSRRLRAGAGRARTRVCCTSPDRCANVRSAPRCATPARRATAR